MFDALGDKISSRSEVLSGVEVSRVFREVLSDSGGESKTEIGVDVDLADSHRSGFAEHILGNALSAGHRAAVLVDHFDVLGDNRGSAVQNDREAGQTLLNSFVEQLALDLPKFMAASGREKAQTLLRIIGLGEQVEELERRGKTLYNERLALGRIADQKAKFAKEMTFYPNVPEEPLSAAELIAQQQDILARNGENQRKRQRRDELKRTLDTAEAQLAELTRRCEQLREDYRIASTDAADLLDQSTAELEENIRTIEQTNAKVRANLDKARAEADAQKLADEYAALTAQIEDVQREKLALLNGADMPLPGLSVTDGELTYNGQPWDCMSSSEQLIAATSIVRRLNPECGFVLLDRLEAMDTDTLAAFGRWLEGEGLQAIATRVSTGGECQIIIEDGMVKDAVPPEEKPQPRSWTKGAF